MTWGNGEGSDPDAGTAVIPIAVDDGGDTIAGVIARRGMVSGDSVDGTAETCDCVSSMSLSSRCNQDPERKDGDQHTE